MLVSAVAALAGDLITFAICRFGGPSAVRWVARGQHADRIEEVRDQFRRHGWQIIVVGRLLPAGRIPVLLAAGALAYPWRRLVPAATVAACSGRSPTRLLGVVSGGIFDSPLLATLLATLLVLLVGGVLNLVAARAPPAARTAAPSRAGRRATAEPSAATDACAAGAILADRPHRRPRASSPGPPSPPRWSLLEPG